MHKTGLGMSVIAGIAVIGGAVRATAGGGVSSVLQTLDELWLTQDGQSITSIQPNGYLSQESPQGIAGSVGDAAVVELSSERMDMPGVQQTTQDAIWIPRGALRDASIVRDDIDRSGLALDTPLDCDPGEVVVAWSETEGVVCATGVSDGIRKSDNAGAQSIYFEGDTVEAKVFVWPSEPQWEYFGLTADGHFQSTDYVVLGDRLGDADTLQISAPSAPLLGHHAGVWSVYAAGGTARLAHEQRLVIGERISFTDTDTPPAVGIRTATPSSELDVAGDVIVDGRWYTIDRDMGVASWMSTLADRQHRRMSTRQSDGASMSSTPDIVLDAPQLLIGGAENPKLSFDFDRRFDAAIDENTLAYDLQISTDYDGTNFETANWQVFQPAVDAMIANNPSFDDIGNTGPLSLEAYEGQDITIAFIFRAADAYFQATSIRIADVRIE